MAERVAAIDIGTNSTRLLVAERGVGVSLRTVERLMRITRLGQGVDRTGSLDAEAMDRTVTVLHEYRGVMDDLGVPAGRVRMTATSASRDASNREVFFDAAEAAVGVRPELLSGDEEAELSFRGATADLDPALHRGIRRVIGGDRSLGTTKACAGASSTDQIEQPRRSTPRRSQLCMRHVQTRGGSIRERDRARNQRREPSSCGQVERG